MVQSGKTTVKVYVLFYLCNIYLCIRITYIHLLLSIALALALIRWQQKKDRTKLIVRSLKITCFVSSFLSYPNVDLF